ncbi:hypothetical protein [Psychrobacter lutiphocae]|uniref:hypothetical protein n=1 Tax=Psychrobacter lutiphocae TaxID=540500 RepID=UPI00191A1427|nr:hypothetical protein [Psychrobacter lutiphocae]
MRSESGEEAANKALEDAKGEDGLITNRTATLKKRTKLLQTPKTKQQRLTSLDPSKGKETLQGNLDAVNVDVAVNDKNSDDINDLTDAQNKVAAYYIQR